MQVIQSKKGSGKTSFMCFNLFPYSNLKQKRIRQKVRKTQKILFKLSKYKYFPYKSKKQKIINAIKKKYKIWILGFGIGQIIPALLNIFIFDDSYFGIIQFIIGHILWSIGAILMLLDRRKIELQNFKNKAGIKNIK